MKYIMFQTQDGRKLPFIFPELLTHVYVAAVMQIMIKQTLKMNAKVASAGFISLGLGAEVTGESESLGIKSIPADAARIMVGESIAFMPDELAEQMLEKLRNAPV